MAQKKTGGPTKVPQRQQRAAGQMPADPKKRRPGGANTEGGALNTKPGRKHKAGMGTNQ